MSRTSSQPPPGGPPLRHAARAALLRLRRVYGRHQGTTIARVFALMLLWTAAVLGTGFVLLEPLAPPLGRHMAELEMRVAPDLLRDPQTLIRAHEIVCSRRDDGGIGRRGYPSCTYEDLDAFSERIRARTLDRAQALQHEVAGDPEVVRLRLRDLAAPSRLHPRWVTTEGAFSVGRLAISAALITVILTCIHVLALLTTRFVAWTPPLVGGDKPVVLAALLVMAAAVLFLLAYATPAIVAGSEGQSLTLLFGLITLMALVMVEGGLRRRLSLPSLLVVALGPLGMVTILGLGLDPSGGDAVALPLPLPTDGLDPVALGLGLSALAPPLVALRAGLPVALARTSRHRP